MTRPEGRVVVLSGAGLSRASGIPTFRDGDGLWRTFSVYDLATPEAFARDSRLVCEFYDFRRAGVSAAEPNAGHRALARLQAAWGTDRVALVTQNIDGLLQRAGCTDVIEMHGSLWHTRCHRDERHAWVPVEGAQPPDLRCACGGPLRPAVVWFGEVPLHLDRIGDLLSGCEVLLVVGTSGVVWPAAGFAQIARRNGARTVEINPVPSGGTFDEVVALGSEVALPRLVDAWLA